MQKRNEDGRKQTGKKIFHKENVEKSNLFVKNVEKTVYFRPKMCYTIITISICVSTQIYYYM